MENNRIKFSNSKFYEINRMLNKKPWKYIYKELMPKSLYKRIQTKMDFLQQEVVAESWDRIIEAYFEGETEKIEVFPKKNLAGRKIIWQYWGTGWEYGKLPDIVKLCYKSADKYKGNYEIIRLDNENMKEYIEFPEFVMEKIENGSMGYTHFSDLLRLALLDSYGGVWLDASILMTGSLSEYSASAGIENKGYFMFQRSDSTENKEFWEKLNSDYFSWNERSKVGVLNSIIFSEKNNKLWLIETNYYGGGGSKLKAVAGEFTELSQFVVQSKDDVEFVWVTDGQGWKTAHLPLSEAFGHIVNVFNLNMLKNNYLHDLFNL